jgi:N6-adenosine-specific RNA methylase IME4
MKYKTIVADPAWQYGIWGSGSEKALVQGEANKPAPLPYVSMTVAEIKAMPVSTLADENCELYLWTTQKYLPDAFEVLKAWGFKYCQTLTWCKTPMGKGQGGVYCPTTEFLLLGRKGKMPKVERIDTTWWNVKRQMKHSKKPEFFQDLIETVSDAPRLEMFARRERKGWDVWGNEVESDIELNTRTETKG